MSICISHNSELHNNDPELYIETSVGNLQLKCNFLSLDILFLNVNSKIDRILLLSTEQLV